MTQDIIKARTLLEDAGYEVNAPESTVMIGVRVPASKRQTLKVWAAEHDTSIAAVIENMIDQLASGSYTPNIRREELK